MIQFTCAACRNSFEVADQHAGRLVNCPNCGKYLQIPARTPARKVPIARPADRPSGSRGPFDLAAASAEVFAQPTSNTRFRLVGIGVFALLLIAIVAAGASFWAIAASRTPRTTQQLAQKSRSPSKTNAKAARNEPDNYEHPSDRKEAQPTDTPSQSLTGKKGPGDKSVAAELQKAGKPPSEKTVTTALELMSQESLERALRKARADEFYLFDLNKTGIRSSFSAGNSRVTSQNEFAKLVLAENCIVETTYDFTARLFNVRAWVRQQFTLRATEQSVLFPLAFLIDLAVPAEPEEARRASKLFREKRLTLDVVFKVKAFEPFSVPNSVGGGDITNTLVRTEVLSARLGSKN